jgi:hypothetical protein
MIKGILIRMSILILLSLESWSAAGEKESGGLAVHRVFSLPEREEQNDVFSLRIRQGGELSKAFKQTLGSAGSVPRDIPNNFPKQKPEEEEDMELILGSSPPREERRTPIKQLPNMSLSLDIPLEFPRYKKKQRSKSLSLEDDQAKAGGLRHYSVPEGVFDMDL